MEFLLNKTLFYRTYQNIIRKKKNDHNFNKFIFENINEKKINVLDVGCGDCHILNYISPLVNNYTGIDNNENYLNSSKKKWKKHKFIHSDFNKNLKSLENHDINFVLIFGLLHHLNDFTSSNIVNKLLDIYPNAYYLIVDPVIDNNNFLNRIMINNDRGKYIRSKKKYKSFLPSFNQLIVDGFYHMSFKYIYHYKQFNLKNIYNLWVKN